MIGGREFHRVGSEFIKYVEFREVLIELQEIRRGGFINDENVIVCIF